ASHASDELPREATASPPSDADLVDRLTPRQREVLSLLAAGLTNRMIGQRLGIETSTARKLTEQVYDRLDVSNRTQAAMYWLSAAHQPRRADPSDPFG